MRGSTAVVTISGQTDPSAADFGISGENLRYSYDFDNDGAFENGFIDLVNTPSVPCRPGSWRTTGW